MPNAPFTIVLEIYNDKISYEDTKTDAKEEVKMFYPLKFKPVYKDYLWGGRNLSNLGKFCLKV